MWSYLKYKNSLENKERLTLRIKDTVQYIKNNAVRSNPEISLANYEDLPYQSYVSDMLFSNETQDIIV